jgi:predicted DNA-binding transcriptional regulator YafY
MPADNNKNTLARQWEMLKILPSRPPGKTAREITQYLADKGYDVTKRTVERDLQALSGTFPLYCNDRSPPFGWYFTPGTHLDIPGFTISEALTLKLVEQYLTPLLPATMLATLHGHFEQATRKLDAMTDNPAARWTEKIRSVPPAQPFLSPVIEHDILESLQHALLTERQVEIGYRKLRAEDVVPYTLHPLGLLQRGPLMYLVATAFTYSDPRLYAVHRIRSITLREGAATRPAGFDLEAFVQGGGGNFGAGANIDLRLRVNADLAANLEEAPLSADMQVTRGDDGIVVTATLPDTWQLRWWLLSQADRVEVLAPAALREEIAQQLQNALAHYGPVHHIAAASS